jgi:hypothetical protein
MNPPDRQLGTGSSGKYELGLRVGHLKNEPFFGVVEAPNKLLHSSGAVGE